MPASHKTESLRFQRIDRNLASDFSLFRKPPVMRSSRGLGTIARESSAKALPDRNDCLCCSLIQSADAKNFPLNSLLRRLLRCGPARHTGPELVEGIEVLNEHSAFNHLASQYAVDVGGAP